MTDDEVGLAPPHALDSARDIPILEQCPGLVFVPVPEGKDTCVKVGFKLINGA
jgi:hypothetical protein